MFSFSKDEKQKIAVYMAQALSEMEHSNDAQEVISNLYCSIMEDASQKTGNAVAKTTTEVIADFNNVMFRLAHNSDFDPMRFFDCSMGDLSREKKCEVLKCFINSLSAFQHTDEGCEKSDDFLQDHVEEQEALVSEVYEKLRNICSGIDADKILDDIKNIDFASLDYIKSVMGADMYAAIKGVIIYGMAKKRELSDIPYNVSLSQCILGSYVETRLVDDIGYAYIMSVNDEWVKKEIAKTLLAFLPAALFIIGVLALLTSVEVVVAAELELAVSSVVTVIVISIPFFWYIGIFVYDILLPMIEVAADKIKSMKTFTEEMVQEDADDNKSEQSVTAKEEETAEANSINCIYNDPHEFVKT